MWKISSFLDKVTNTVLNFTDAEVRVREATNDEEWGPSTTQMTYVLQLLNKPGSYTEIMDMLWARMLGSHKFRHIHKSLVLLHFLIKHGPEQIYTEAKDHMVHIAQLEKYSFYNSKGENVGKCVSIKATEVMKILQDYSAYKAERLKGQRTRHVVEGCGNEVASCGQHLFQMGDYALPDNSAQNISNIDTSQTQKSKNNLKLGGNQKSLKSTQQSSLQGLMDLKFGDNYKGSSDPFISKDGANGKSNSGDFFNIPSNTADSQTKTMGSRVHAPDNNESEMNETLQKMFGKDAANMLNWSS